MSATDSIDHITTEAKGTSSAVDIEQQGSHHLDESKPAKSLGAGVGYARHPKAIVLTILQSALALGAFGTTLTTLSLSLMEWRGVTTTNVFVANFFFIAAFGLVVTAQWELSIGNGFAYTVFSAFGEYHPNRTGPTTSAIYTNQAKDSSMQGMEPF